MPTNDTTEKTEEKVKATKPETEKQKQERRDQTHAERARKSQG